jgi:hypothetical protein
MSLFDPTLPFARKWQDEFPDLLGCTRRFLQKLRHNYELLLWVGHGNTFNTAILVLPLLAGLYAL